MKRLGVFLGLVLICLSKVRADDLKLGSLAPDFTAAASDGKRIHLAEYLDHAPIVLYFYPKEDSPEDAKEACNFRDNFSGFRDLKATILGINYNSTDAHRKFIQKYHLPFLLLTDLDHSIAKAYGAGGIFAPSRQTFIIDKRGTIIYIERFPKTSTQSLELQNALAQL